MTFEEWMEQVDRCCQLDFGLSLDDLPIVAFQDGLNSGISPPDFVAENLPDEETISRRAVTYHGS